MNKTFFYIIVVLVIIVFVVTIWTFTTPVGAFKGGIPGKPPGIAAYCDDHIDNDGDGYCDYSWKKAYCNDGSIVGDSGCLSKDDNDEIDCGDGICSSSENYETCPADCEQPCNCGSWINQGCGVGDCAYDQILQTRTCTPAGCNIESRCINDESCVTQPDSCSDTDGGYNILTRGIVSGYSVGIPYNHTDFCATNLTLVEFYCSGTTFLNSSSQCNLNLTSYCFNGACV